MMRLRILWKASREIVCMIFRVSLRGFDLRVRGMYPSYHGVSFPVALHCSMSLCSPLRSK